MARTHRFHWFRGSLVRLAWLVAALVIALGAGPSQLGSGLAVPQDSGTGRHGGRSQAPDVNPSDKNAGTPLTAKQKAAMMKTNFEKTKDDASELADMATGLRDELNKTNINILSVDVIHRAEKIEKLAKKIKEEAKGY